MNYSLVNVAFLREFLGGVFWNSIQFKIVLGQGNSAILPSWI